MEREQAPAGRRGAREGAPTLGRQRPGGGSELRSLPPRPADLEGTLYYVCEQGTGITRRARTRRLRVSPSQRQGRDETGPRWSASAAWPFLRPGGTCGYAATRMAIYRPPDATPRDESSTGTTRLGARCATRASSNGSPPSAGPCRTSGEERKPISLGPTSARRRCSAWSSSLMDETLLRVGNEEYARQNEAYGLTTLRDRHAFVCGSEIRLVFRGKGGKTQIAGLQQPAAGPGGEAQPGVAGRDPLPVPGRRGQSGPHNLRRRERIPSRVSPAGSSARKTSGHGAVR